MKNSTPLVSVIMSCYNVEKCISEALTSILGQTYKNVEIIISDDGSNDTTRTIIDSISDIRIKRFHNEHNLGLLETWNKLLAQTKGEYITFQDGDDISLPERIERLVLFLESNPEIGLCGTNFIRYFDAWNLFQKSNYPLTDYEIREELKKEMVPFNGTRVMVRRTVYEKIGGFREFFKGLAAEDFDWILRIADHYKVSNIPDVLYEYRYFNRSQSKNSLESEPKRIFVTKIIFFLSKQRALYGADALEMNNVEQIEEFLAPYCEQLNRDKTNYFRFKKVFNNALSNKDYASAWSLLKQRLHSYPLKRTNLVNGYQFASGFSRTFVKAALNRLFGIGKFASSKF